MNWGKFRKKPIVIEAVQWNPEEDDQSFYSPGRIITTTYGELKITTLEGTMTANPGDWVVRGIQGELYPVRDDIFRATYEEVHDG